jgi:quinoprotein glucose dehydrogenase
LPLLRPGVGAPLFLALFIQVAAGQTDWPTYGHDSGSTRYSPLKQITAKNVSKLALAWTYHMNVTGAAGGNPPSAPPPPAGAAPAGRGGGRGGGGRARSSEATPIVVKGVMYLPTPYGRVLAL